MPELPDIELYLHALSRRLEGQPLRSCQLTSPFLLRTVSPPPSEALERRVSSLTRLGKRIVIGFEEELYFVIHLMIAGRFQWKDHRPESSTPHAPPKRTGLAAFDFPTGTLLLTEAGSKKRAALWVVQGHSELTQHDPGGIEPLECSASDFQSALAASSHTIKRTLTDPRIFAGIGNAYSDEILHRARLSPFKRSKTLKDEEARSLFAACRDVLTQWRDRLIESHGDRFPKKVTAFQPEMAVHGKFNQPCPVCDKPVQRIVYANNEANYCARCQTGGRLLSDRALARLLKDDWPKTLDELELKALQRASDIQSQPGPSS